MVKIRSAEQHIEFKDFLKAHDIFRTGIDAPVSYYKDGERTLYWEDRDKISITSESSLGGYLIDKNVDTDHTTENLKGAGPF